MCCQQNLTLDVGERPFESYTTQVTKSASIEMFKGMQHIMHYAKFYNLYTICYQLIQTVIGTLDQLDQCTVNYVQCLTSTCLQLLTKDHRYGLHVTG